MSMLQQKNILVTRPEDQAANLCQMIKAAGGTPIAYPTMAIEAITPASLPNLNDFDHVIFISANAVTYAEPHIDLKGIKSVACVGSRTQSALEKAGVSVDLVPESQFNSEGLLALPALNQAEGKHILIVRGIGGKEALKDSLEQRGASVTYFECYKRTLPQIDYQPLRYAFLNRDIDIITSSSSQSLMNLLQICPNAIDVPLVSISPDMTEKARAWGYAGTIIEAENATDDAILMALKHFITSSP